MSTETETSDDIKDSPIQVEQVVTQNDQTQPPTQTTIEPTTASRDTVSNQNDEIPALSGYLFKKTRDGRWQRRYFETNGIYLTYYKSKKMEKLLAALTLTQVGEIALCNPENKDDPNPKDNEDSLFSIELNSRIYTLRAKNKEEAELWVSTLIKLRDQENSRFSNLNSDGIRMQSFHIDSGGRPSTLTGKSKLLVENNSNNQATWIKSGQFCCTWCFFN